jgi:hypothetical protein
LNFSFLDFGLFFLKFLYLYWISFPYYASSWLFHSIIGLNSH